MSEQRNEVATDLPATVERVVARQPIVGLDDRIVGFELLHRPSAEAAPTGAQVDGTLPVSALLGDLSVDVDELLGDTPRYCQPDPGLLTGDAPVTPPARRTVLVVPAAVGTDPEVVDRCRALRQAGYSVAADVGAWLPGLEPLLEVADVVRIDVATLSREQVLDLAARCAEHDVTLLAARCGTEDDLTWAAGAGFALFHGPAVQNPVEVSGTTLAPSAVGQVQLATELLDERLDFGRVEAILNHEPALVVQVLHHASIGAGGGMRREVHSVREALVLLGTTRLRQWAALTVLSRQVSHSRTDALAAALVRARMCELLAQSRGIDRGFAFTAGLLSSLDRLLGVPIDEVESTVDVDDELAAAAFRRETPVGELVGLVADYQDAVDALQPSGPGLGDVEMVAAMAFCWAMSHINAIERTVAA